MKITITDIAERVGVSPSTVSRAMHDHPSISQETKDKVHQAMKDMGYEANSAQETEKHSIGIIFPAWASGVYENPFFLETVIGICRYCNEQKYSVNVIYGDSSDEILKSIRLCRAEGYIILYSGVDDAVIRYMQKENILYVLIGKPASQTNTTIYVDNDNVEAAREACEYLIGLGHTRIGFVGADETRVFSNDRFLGYLSALRAHGIDFNPGYVLYFDYAEKEKDADALVTQKNAPTAYIAYDDICAVRLTRVLQKCGMRVPEDVSVIGFNNSIFARQNQPPLTSIDINTEQLGIEAASQLLKHLLEPGLMAAKIIVPYQLVRRDSCARHK
jgi:DNA-binding LacI/PurR family transcriptional regulator